MQPNQTCQPTCICLHHRAVRNKMVQGDSVWPGCKCIGIVDMYFAFIPKGWKSWVFLLLPGWNAFQTQPSCEAKSDRTEVAKVSYGIASYGALKYLKSMAKNHYICVLLWWIYFAILASVTTFPSILILTEWCANSILKYCYDKGAETTTRLQNPFRN